MQIVVFLACLYVASIKGWLVNNMSKPEHGSQMSYLRGWSDCLEALSHVPTDKEIRKLIPKLVKAIHEKKFAKIREELGIYDLF